LPPGTNGSSRCRGLASTHLKYAEQADHSASASANLFLTPRGPRFVDRSFAGLEDMSASCHEAARQKDRQKQKARLDGRASVATLADN
jgi:hypothetical protein